ncbi:M23 family metallopeptidase [Lysobacter sp. S4-A87]|uniref:peptidoglycan DD-metalloendopeptidase family protein n=1 Tax=Lysobacter sp. S4-A87 TaxID=2925843 RepID=UPI001F5317FC|nr:M23 family metallopeptidase [Lysobacter sp. S4-A87]UNK50774.1 M23 family metallopeptidase [Lysobacter sp. S4-A87]
MATRRHLAAATIGIATVLVAFAAGAAKVYRWTDSNGITHYGDHVPDASTTQVRAIPVYTEPSAIARLRIENDGDRYLAFADNRLSGPIEVQLDFSRSDNVVGRPLLPARATVAARGSALVAVLQSADPERGFGFELQMESLPGDPSARPQNVDYVLPLQQEAFRIDQGYGGHFSHNDGQSRYAVDFAAAIGTPVLAARGGVVMQVESDFDKAGLNLERFGGRANFVRILHDDGSMTLYGHLKADDGVLVRVGQRVRAGQQIGLSGNTGFTTGPHLHFAVQVNRGMRLESIPFRMQGPTGPLRISGGRGGL